MDQYGNAYAPLLDNVAADTGVDPDYLARIMKIESGGDPNNRTGSYRGLFQLSPSEFAKYGGTGNIYDPEQNARAAANKTAAEAQAFQEKFGRAPTSTDLYMTHQQGEGGYAQHIAAPDAPAWQNMYATAEGQQKGPGWAKQAIWGNIPDNLKPRFGSVNNVTSQDLIDIYARKLGYGADQLPLAFGPTGSPAGNPMQADPNAPEGGSPAGNPMQADVLAQLEARAAGDGGATDVSGQRRMLPRPVGAPAGLPAGLPAAPTGPPTGNLPFGIPGTAFNNPVQAALGDNFSTLLAFAGGARQGGIGQGLTQAAKASLIEGPEVQKMKQLRDQQLGVYQALRAKGLPHADAMSAAMSPEIMKAVAPEVFGSPKIVKVGQDIAGNEVYAQQHPGGRLTPIQLEGAPGGGAGGIAGLGHPTDKAGNPLMGDELLGHLEKSSPTAAAMVKAIGRGDASVTPRNLQKYLPLAESVYPSLQQFNYDVRKKSAVDFAPGNKSANNVKALETVGGHIDKMMNEYDKMGNTWQPEFNTVKNWFAERFGDKGATTFNTFATGVANELGTVFRSYGMSDSEVKSWRDRIASSASPTQFNGNMGALGDMLKTRRDVLVEQYKQQGKDPPPTMFQNLDKAIARIESLGQQPGPTPTQTAPAAAAPAPVTGFKVLGVR